MKKKQGKIKKNSIKKISIWAFVFVLILFCIFIIVNLIGKEDATISSGVSNNFIENFELKKIPSYDSVMFTGEYDDKIIKIKRFNDFDLEKSEQYISDKMFVIESLYREIHSPYPGELSNRIRCPEEFKPLKKSNEPFDYYIIYASKRLSYGACSDDLIEYVSINYFLYCEKQNNFFHIELFIPKEENISYYENLLKSVRCLK